MLQIVPCVHTICSYSAISLPRTSGVSLSARIVFDGRFPSNTRCGTSQSAVPSAFTCSAVFAESQRLSLRKHVRHQNVMMSSQRIQRLVEPDKIARNQPRSLVDQLVERMLPV